MRLLSFLNQYRRDPVLVLGMHRAGTTLVSQILRQMGVFQGTSLEGHHEPVFFRDANEWILRSIHAGWDRPEAVRELYADRVFCHHITRRLVQRVQSVGFIKSFVGLNHIRRFYGQADMIWGWKEPRMTLTFPLWRPVFPQAKVLFIHRNGIDTANSLVNREEWRIKQNIPVHNVFDDPFFSLRCRDFERAFSLWEAYNTLFFENWQRWSPSDPLMILCYETLLKNPVPSLTRIADFIGITTDRVHLNRISETIHSRPRFRFLQDERLWNQYTRKRATPMMIKLGYDTLDCYDHPQTQHFSSASLQ
jgi:hypothetical protein